jgi:hypothetical protein
LRIWRGRSDGEKAVSQDGLPDTPRKVYARREVWVETASGHRLRAFAYVIRGGLSRKSINPPQEFWMPAKKKTKKAEKPAEQPAQQAPA